MTDEFNPSEWITTKEAAELSDHDPEVLVDLIWDDGVEARQEGDTWYIERDSLPSPDSGRRRDTAPSFNPLELTIQDDTDITATFADDEYRRIYLPLLLANQDSR